MTSLPLVDRLSRFFSRRSGLDPQDVDDFVASVRLHLLEDDYAVLRQFEGRCTLATYLSMVIQRLLFDRRGQQWGRFRTSAAAQRLGPVAVRLELLVLRDGWPLHEAVARLASHGEEISLIEAERIVAQLPPRKPRAVTCDVDEISAPQLAVDAATVEEPVAAGERRALSATVDAAMRAAMDALPAEDRAILRMHFTAGLSVADISRALGLVQRQTYRRIHRIYDALRARLRAAGVRESEVAALLGRADVELDFGLHEVEKPAGASSTGAEGHSTP